MTATTAALGAIIGYLGAEVAEGDIFERLLWPQRFYNHLELDAVIKLAFLMPMGGPVHRAALITLDNFRKNGLYRGHCQGQMLGTAFFQSKDTVG